MTRPARTTSPSGRRARARRWIDGHRDVTTIVFLVTLVVGSVVRIVGLGWGLPLHLHPDEPVIVNGVLDMVSRHSFEPSTFMRPDHVEIQLSYLGYQFWAHVVMHTGVAAAYASSPGTFFVISRSVTAVFGIATIVLAFLIGRRFDPRIGAMAALAFALMPLLVREAHYATPDIPLTCMMMVVVLSLMHYLTRPQIPALLVACLGTSVGIAIKYPAALATLMIAVVVIVAAVRERRYVRILGHGILSLGAVTGFLFAISPVLFTNFAAVEKQLTGQGRVIPGTTPPGWGDNLGFYIGSFVGDAGLLLTVASVIGMVAAIRGRMLQAVPLTLGAVYWLLLSVLPLHWDRWGLPMFITPVMFASIGAFHAFRWAGAHRWRVPVAWVLGTVVVVHLLVGAIALDLVIRAPDTRASARPGMEEAGINSTNTAFEGYSPLLPGSPKTVFDEFTLVDGRPRPVDRNVRYLLLSGCMSPRFYADPAYAKERGFYRAAREHLTLVRSWKRAAPPETSWIEPLDLVDDIRTITTYATGGEAGCDVRIYSVD